jgi:hypothetical protein
VLVCIVSFAQGHCSQERLTTAALNDVVGSGEATVTENSGQCLFSGW